MCVRVRERVQRVCVCGVCESECVCVLCVCGVCVCGCEESACVCVYERERESVCVYEMRAS